MIKTFNNFKDHISDLIDNYEILFYIIVGIYLVYKLWGLIFAWITRRKIIATVNNLERVNYPLYGSSIYLAFTDKGVLKDVDTIYFWKFNSSDLFGMLRVGDTYEFTISGRRRRWSSNYPNIIKIKEI